jgi:hypothetical protein
MKTLAALVFSLITSLSFAQTDSCACCQGHYQDFSFWLGDWVVYDTSGTEIGENLILSLQDKCVMQENWKSANSSGTSYNYYNAADSTWNQLWIDNNGGSLILKGNLVGGAMVLKSELVKTARAEYFNKITWTPNSDGSVLQLWECVDENDQLLFEAFRGKYVRRKKSN